MLGYTWRTRGIIFATNLAIIAIFAGIGHILDRAFDKKAFFIFLLLIISFPLPTIIIRRMVKKQRAATPSKAPEESEKLDATSIKKYIS